MPTASPCRRYVLPNAKETIVFLGAGASKCFGIPVLKELDKHILNLPGGFGKQIRDLKKRFEANSIPFNTQNLLAFLETSCNKRLRYKEAGPVLLSFVKGNKKFDMRSVAAHKKLIDVVKSEIRNRCIVQKDKLHLVRKKMDFFLRGLVRNRKFGLSAEIPIGQPIYPSVELFTTNYDDVLETFCEWIGIEAVDGYVETVPVSAKTGWIVCKFDEHEFDLPNVLRIYKLYGSVRYARRNDYVVRIEPRTWPLLPTVKDLLIYPGATECIWNEPQLQLFYRLQQCLYSASYSLIVGYSFPDRAVADVFRNALRLNPSMKSFLIDKRASWIVREVFGNPKSMKPINIMFEDFDPVKHLR